MTEPESASVRRAFGDGLATTDDAGTTMSVWYPAPALGEAPLFDPPEVAMITPAVGHDPATGLQRHVVRTEIDLDEPPATVEDAYLRLHLLSHCLVEPNTIDLDGIFGVLPNVVWTSHGPFAPDDFERVRARLLAAGRGPVTVTSIDKFPRMVDFVVPPGVRIGDASRVRLGAHLAPGTTVMHEGFVNYNAGTLGESMVEGRISQGVVVGDGSDVGGGASIMGTLSGGGKQRVSIGRGSLLGANSGLGISLGDNCTVEAGLYVTAGTKVTVLGDRTEAPKTLKAVELSGRNDLLFRRNSQSGAVEVLNRPPKSVHLNEALHQQ